MTPGLNIEKFLDLSIKTNQKKNSRDGLDSSSSLTSSTTTPSSSLTFVADVDFRFFFFFVNVPDFVVAVVDEATIA